MYYEIQIIEKRTNRLLHGAYGDKSTIDNVLQQFNIQSINDVKNYIIESKTTYYEKVKITYIKKMICFEDLLVFLIEYSQ